MYKSIACLTIFLLMIFAFAPSCTDEDEKYINDESALFVSSFSIGDIKFTITEDSIIGYCKPNIDVTNLAPTFVASGEM
ncbi:MAG: hypothetical protein IKR52_00005, partial [Paludibacteraceae bacterium]|nr:hypothetical protein [Paludibacteraceae bacterium]